MKITGIRRAAMAALLVALSASGVAAQSTATVTDTDEIVALEAKAAGYLADLDQWDRAASLFRRAAELRSAGDPIATDNLIKAARLSFYQGREGRSVRDFEAAGRRAMAMGDVLVAANAFADGAWVARARGDAARANDLLVRARLLSASPLISEIAREGLQARWSVASQQQ